MFCRRHFEDFRWATFLAFLALSCHVACAQEEDEEEPHLPGLTATYSDEARHSFRRLDEAIAFHWGDAAPDPRLLAKSFAVRWQGKLFAQGTGEYRLALFASGQVEVKLAGKTVIPRQEVKGAWIFAEPVTLPFDHHPLEIAFRQTREPAQIALYWSGPQFQLEPVPPRHLFHDRKETFVPHYEPGEALAAALRCASCHREEKSSQPMAAPSLMHLADNINEGWLRDWLKQESSTPGKISRRMPLFGFSDQEAAAIEAYLLRDKQTAAGTRSAPAAPTPKTKPKAGEKPKEAPSTASGERLFLTLGCLACHQVKDLGESGLFGGGDLTQIAAKRPSPFFAAWLKDPTKLNPDHRMPVFDLSDDERTSLSLYFASLTSALKNSEPRQPPAELVTQGRKLVATHRCASCHALPKDAELAAPEGAKPLSDQSDWSKSCALTPKTSKAHLGYSLTEKDQQALREFFSAKRARDSAKKQVSGRLALVQNNCLACHGREGVESLSSVLPARLAEKLAAVAEKHEQLAPLVPAMTPPSLNSIGDKLHDAALEGAIRRKGPPHRDYLLVRMPRFPLADDEMKRLIDYFVSADRIPLLPANTSPKQDPSQEAAFSLAGSRLVSSDGFGCTSCHQVGKVIPDKAPLNARGPALSSLDKRVRKEWYDRFLRSPSRIVPRMEMPSVQIPVRGVLSEKLDDQLSALWHVLSTPSFEPPEPNPFRVLRMAGGKAHDEAQTILDTIHHRDTVFTKPVLMAFSNRHNLLFDLETNRLAAWYVGDAASQRTKGKSWFWVAGGHDLLVNQSPDPELSLAIDGQEVKPLLCDQVLAQPFRLFAGQSLLFEYSVSFQAATSKEPIHLLITEVFSDWQSQSEAPSTTVAREVFIRGVPKGATLHFRALDEDSARKTILRENVFSLAGEHRAQVSVDANEWQQVRTSGLIIARRHDADEFGYGQRRERGVKIRLQYSTQLPIDRFAESQPAPAVSDVSQVDVGQGLSATRLPLPVNVLPTALAFQPDGTLVAGTLTGNVFLAVDAHPKDGVEETTYTLADGLPAPYGLFASANSVDVLTKTELVRVPAAPSRGVIQFVTSGWGHTADYHDWAIGLPQNERGEYYIGLPCQQDERSPAGARFRGTVARLVPRKSTKNDPREYSIDVLSTGHRFPMGLAVNHDGDLFVTDNQGNYNPFNELNHVRKGAFFGFVNANDKKNKDYKPPPVTEPAINIPHPWTRSVNGICFLYTPKKLREETGKDAFGPLEGQLVGCEYDTRRLIRMSLQKIGDTYQGAAYPLSQEPSSPEKGFLGPIVCAVSPRGDLYVGSIRESGWGAGNNVGEIVKIKFEAEKLPCGIREVKAIKGGFTIDFLREVDAKKAAEIVNYSIASYRRISTPAYGGPDVDRRTEKISSVEVAENHRRVTVQLPEMRTGFVYEIQLKNLAPADAEFFPSEAYFTLHGIP